jgi:hypothetical protein
MNQLLLETINQTETDLESKIFINYQEYPTSAGIVLKVLQMRSLSLTKGCTLEL